MTLSSIPLSELKADLAESLMDMRACRIAIREGVLRTPAGDVKYRLSENARIVRVILGEVERRLVAGELTSDAEGLLISR